MLLQQATRNTERSAVKLITVILTSSHANTLTHSGVEKITHFNAHIQTVLQPCRTVDILPVALNAPSRYIFHKTSESRLPHMSTCHETYVGLRLLCCKRQNALRSAVEFVVGLHTLASTYPHRFTLGEKRKHISQRAHATGAHK